MDARSNPRFFVKGDSGLVRCELCPHRCSIKSGGFGLCRVRGNKNGKGSIPLYGMVSALALDPVEKKPLYHFRPGTAILSVGFAGCNLRCPFCQNWRISQNTNIAGKIMEPDELVAAALDRHVWSIAYTYSEPLVHIEYLLDCMALARRSGIANVLVTNGCANAATVREILSLTDAANIDLKCFSGDTYSKILGGDLQSTLDFIRLAHSMQVHTEITTLLVPGLNDSEAELDHCADFIAALPETIPWHLSAYHPDYRWNAPPTDPALLLRAAKRAQTKLRYVYSGNIAGENNTRCPHCGGTLARRNGYQVDTAGLVPPAEGERRFRCKNCGKKTDITV
ncbi:MAG: AmmeMemoRadiSam system radical SAM enzyme [Treponema sp.]|nr:AmmeMemoRadiSam system radical SAM enzyme [Treponema sp.]